MSRKLNWREACAILGCGRSKFYELVKSGRLRAWKIAGSKRGLFVHLDDVQKLLELIYTKTN